MTREEVYKLIDSERDYQDSRRDIREESDEQKSPAEWLNYIEHCLSKAKEANYFLDKVTTMANIRKIAGLAVRAMEIHETPKR